MRSRAVLLALLPLAALSYPNGIKGPCPGEVGNATNFPNHGINRDDAGNCSIIMTWDGFPHADYFRPASKEYSIGLTCPPGPFRGYLIAAFQGSNTSLTRFDAPKAGRLVPADNNSQAAGQCDAITHIDPSDKFFVTFRWAPANSSGPVTFWAVVTTNLTGPNYQVKYTVGETSVAPSPFAPGPQATPSLGPNGSTSVIATPSTASGTAPSNSVLPSPSNNNIFTPGAGGAAPGTVGPQGSPGQAQGSPQAVGGGGSSTGGGNGTTSSASSNKALVSAVSLLSVYVLWLNLWALAA